MACISYCPTEAIEYGKKSLGQVRYTVEKALKDEPNQNESFKITKRR